MELPEDIQFYIWKIYYSNHVMKELHKVATKVDFYNIWLPIACRNDWLKRMYIF